MLQDICLLEQTINYTDNDENNFVKTLLQQVFVLHRRRVVGTCNREKHWLQSLKFYILLYLRNKHFDCFTFSHGLCVKHNMWSLPLGKKKTKKKQATVFHSCPLHACVSGNLWQDSASPTDCFTSPRLSDSLFIVPWVYHKKALYTASMCMASLRKQIINRTFHTVQHSNYCIGSQKFPKKLYSIITILTCS